MHRYRDGEVAIPGFLDDYAFFSGALFELYETTFDPPYLSEAARLLDQMHQLFWDVEGGGFYLAVEGDADLIVRPKETYDGALPSGNSMALTNLLRVGRLTMKRDLEDLARQAMESFSGQLSSRPANFTQMLIALDFALGPSREVVIAGREDDASTRRMLEILNEKFIPNMVFAFRPEKADQAKRIQAVIPFLKNQRPLADKATGYICKNYVCNFPTTDIDEFQRLLEK